MGFVDNPITFNLVLNEQCLLDDVYKALRAEDMTGAVMSALKVLRDTQTLPDIVNDEKSSDRSRTYINEGNTFYTRQIYRRALEQYNKALLYAPKDSIELVEAYSNRSALLLSLSAFSACLNDIETCFKLQCTEELIKTLNKRKEECQKMIWRENFRNNLLSTPFVVEFFKFNVKKHPEIPSLSADVNIVSESGERRAVAAKNISIGTVLAIETAYTTHSNQDKSYFTCYYCQSMTLNLTPCDSCCFALFCSAKCKELCVDEYHLVECQIMNVLRKVDVSPKFRLAIKTVLKLKTQCKEWKTLIKESQNIGASRLKTSSVNEIYDVKNYSSILSFNEDRHFIHGIMYNRSFVHATVIHHLQNVCGFFPEAPKDRLEAQKCLAKLLMTMELMWPCNTEIGNAAEELNAERIVTDLPNHFGWLPFTSKLKHDCEPNVLVLGLDNRVCLVACRPIKKMTELKVSYIGHWYDRMYKENRYMNIFRATGGVCACRVCKGAWSVDNLTKSDLTDFQKKTYRSWVFMGRNAQLSLSFFKETCKALTVLDDQVNTKEHQTLFLEFLMQLRFCQFGACKNFKF